MSITNTVTDRYRTATDRLITTNWTKAAGVYFGVQLATLLWVLYLIAFMTDGSGNGSLTDPMLGVTDPDAFLVAIVLGTFASPFLYVACRVVAPKLPVRRHYATLFATWAVAGPVPYFGWMITDEKVSEAVAAISSGDYDPLLAIGVWLSMTGLLALFVTGAYTLSTGIIRPSSRQRRALIVTIAVLVAVPIGVGAAFPMDGSGAAATGYDDYESMSADERYGGNITDPETYDNNHTSPYIESVTPLEESRAVVLADDPRPPAANETLRNYTVAETHTDKITVRDVEATVRGETVVPQARYHLSLEGVNATDERILAMGTYGTIDADGHTRLGQPAVYIASVYGVDSGFYLSMERVESTHVYFDVVTDDGEIHRYVAEIQRTDV